ncbi:hypothetical protein [Blastococcus sp. SYSU DS1024]
MIGTGTFLAAVVAFSLPGVAAADEHETLTVEPSTVQDGGSIQVSGQCESAGEDEDVAVLAGRGFEGGLLGRVPLAEDGSFEGSVTIPAGAPSATGEVSVPCPEGGTVLRAPLTIEGDQPQVPFDPVPDGGVDAGLGGGAGTDPALIALGASGAALTLGGVALGVRRRHG